MRKALQAEQSKAEILIKIQNVEEECNDLEDQVEDLKKRINRQLRELEREKKLSLERHQEDIQRQMMDNMKFLAEVKQILTTFEESKREDE
jgi:hypothetical protein